MDSGRRRSGRRARTRTVTAMRKELTTAFFELRTRYPDLERADLLRLLEASVALDNATAQSQGPTPSFALIDASERLASLIDERSWISSVRLCGGGSLFSLPCTQVVQFGDLDLLRYSTPVALEEDRTTPQGSKAPWQLRASQSGALLGSAAQVLAAQLGPCQHFLRSEFNKRDMRACFHLSSTCLRWSDLCMLTGCFISLSA